MTYLELVNDVLTLLREDDVSSVDESAYSNLISKFVNIIKRECEDTWDWTLLRDSIDFSTTDGDFSYYLDGAGKRFRVLRDIEGWRNAWNVTDELQMRGPVGAAWMTKRLKFDGTKGSPIYFDFNGQFNGDPVVNVYPIPDGEYTIQFDLVVPQEDLSSDSEELTIPHWPVVLGAYFLAIRERGEDRGTSLAQAADDYKQALQDAIMQDRGNHPTELIARVV